MDRVTDRQKKKQTNAETYKDRQTDRKKTLINMQSRTDAQKK